MLHVSRCRPRIGSAGESAIALHRAAPSLKPSRTGYSPSLYRRTSRYSPASTRHLLSSQFLLHQAQSIGPLTQSKTCPLASLRSVAEATWFPARNGASSTIGVADSDVLSGSRASCSPPQAATSETVRKSASTTIIVVMVLVGTTPTLTKRLRKRTMESGTKLASFVMEFLLDRKGGRQSRVTSLLFTMRAAHGDLQDMGHLQYDAPVAVCPQEPALSLPKGTPTCTCQGRAGATSPHGSWGGIPVLPTYCGIIRPYNVSHTGLL